MRRLNVRIGARLGIFAFVGLILVAGMVGNQARVNGLTRDLMNKASESRELQQAALEAKSNLNELISIDRDIRLARTATEIDQILQYLQNCVVSADAAYDSAIAMATLDEDRVLLTTAKTAFNNYVAAAREIAGVQYEIVDLRDRQIEENAVWSQNFESVINSPAVVRANNRQALESNLQQANSEFMRVGALSWSRFVRNDSDDLRRIADALGTAALVLDEARLMVTNPQLRAAIEGLLKSPPRYKTIVEALTQAVRAQGDLLRLRADPPRVEASDMLSFMATGTDQRADRLAALSFAEAASASWINLAVRRARYFGDGRHRDPVVPDDRKTDTANRGCAALARPRAESRGNPVSGPP